MIDVLHAEIPNENMETIFRDSLSRLRLIFNGSKDESVRSAVRQTVANIQIRVSSYPDIVSYSRQSVLKILDLIQEIFPERIREYHAELCEKGDEMQAEAEENGFSPSENIAHAAFERLDDIFGDFKHVNPENVCDEIESAIINMIEQVLFEKELTWTTDKILVSALIVMREFLEHKKINDAQFLQYMRIGQQRKKELLDGQQG